MLITPLAMQTICGVLPTSVSVKVLIGAVNGMFVVIVNVQQNKLKLIFAILHVTHSQFTFNALCDFFVNTDPICYRVVDTVILYQSKIDHCNIFNILFTISFGKLAMRHCLF